MNQFKNRVHLISGIPGSTPHVVLEPDYFAVECYDKQVYLKVRLVLLIKLLPYIVEPFEEFERMVKNNMNRLSHITIHTHITHNEGGSNVRVLEFTECNNIEFSLSNPGQQLKPDEEYVDIKFDALLMNSEVKNFNIVKKDYSEQMQAL